MAGFKKHENADPFSCTQSPLVCFQQWRHNPLVPQQNPVVNRFSTARYCRGNWEGRDYLKTRLLLLAFRKNRGCGTEGSMRFRTCFDHTSRIKRCGHWCLDLQSKRA